MAPTAQKNDFFLADRMPSESFGFYGAIAKIPENSQLVSGPTEESNGTANDYHRDMFDQKVKKADMRAVFTEYAWDMNWYDPCAADPLIPEELRSLGVVALNETPPDLVPGRGPRPVMPPMGGARDVYVLERINLRIADFGNEGELAKTLDELTAAA